MMSFAPDDVNRPRSPRPPEELLREYNRQGFIWLETKDIDAERDELKSILQSAMILEHTTIPVYLSALYSLRPEMPWRVAEILRTIVVEEMLHLTLAANLLNAIGGNPVFNDPAFLPDYPTYLPYRVDGIKLNLLPFSPEFLFQALAIEHPKGVNPERVDVGARDEVARQAMTIGEFYVMVHSKIESFAKTFGEENLFTVRKERQVLPYMHYYDAGGQPLEVTDLQSARNALRIITDQGEGIERSVWAEAPLQSGEPREASHYARFLELRDKKLFRDGDTLASGPSGESIEVPMFRTYNIGTNAKLKDYPVGSEARAYATAFNHGYWDLLRSLENTFRGTPQGLEEGVQRMARLRDDATQLIRNPFPGKEAQGLFAAPTFEYVPASGVDPSTA